MSAGRLQDEAADIKREYEAVETDMNKIIARGEELKREAEAHERESKRLSKEMEKNVAMAGLEVAQQAVDNQGRRKKKDNVFPIFWLLLNSLCLWKWSTTLGGKVMKLRVVTLDDGKPLDGKLALLRTLMTFVSTASALLGWVWVVWEKDGRGWHDLVVGTRVVDAD